MLLRRTLRGVLLVIVIAVMLQFVTEVQVSASTGVKNGQPCKKGNKSVIQKDLLFQCVNKAKSWRWQSSRLNTAAGVAPTSTQQANIPVSPLVLPEGSNPALDCTGSGESSGMHPGWNSKESIKLTLVDVSSSTYGLYWCPAAAPNGQGVISYTVTSSIDASTCETTQTSCEMNGVAGTQEFEIMATDQTGSYLSTSPAIQNSGSPLLCNTHVNFCNPGAGYLTFPTYGNVAPQGIGDCTFAAVADWEEIALGTVPDPELIQTEFVDAGGTDSQGLTDAQVFSYWQNHGIGGSYLNYALPFYTDPAHLMSALDDTRIKAVIASLNFTKGQNFAGVTLPDSSYHWVVVDGYTPEGPLVATWGKTLQMTWQQWNLEVVSMWGITISQRVPSISQ